jgi:hypothetical protein
LYKAKNLTSEKKTIEPWISKEFPAPIWNILAHPVQSILFLELRDEQKKSVSFSALNLDTKSMLYENVVFDEPWWISHGEVVHDLLLLKIYADTNNPDKKSIVAYDFSKKEIRWWKNNYAISGVNEQFVLGYDTTSLLNFKALKLENGEVEANPLNREPIHNFSLLKPFQYHQGTANFETVQTFLRQFHNLDPVALIEYLEYNEVIIVSCYARESDLANYLLVIQSDGKTLVREKIGERLQGIGLDTFFILSGFLIFAKNKRVLVSYKMV